jgi:hypothetical protein
MKKKMRKMTTTILTKLEENIVEKTQLQVLRTKTTKMTRTTKTKKTKMKMKTRRNCK